MNILYATWLEFMFGEGTQWPVPTSKDYTTLVIFIVISIAFFVYLKLYYSARLKKIHEDQLFLFKARQKGLTDYQSKMVQGMVKITGLKEPVLLLTEEYRFENSIGRFLTYISSRNETQETLLSICHDIIITYEKIFHYSSFKKPLTNISEVELNILVFFFTDSGIPYIGKLRKVNPDIIVLKLFRSGTKALKLEGKPVTVYLWRSGDAEYTFTSSIKKIEKDSVEIITPPVITRGKEARHPYINVFIPCNIIDENPPEKNEFLNTLSTPNTTAEITDEYIDRILAEEKTGIVEQNAVKTELIEADIIKINEAEAIIRSIWDTMKDLQIQNFQGRTLFQQGRYIIQLYKEREGVTISGEPCR